MVKFGYTILYVEDVVKSIEFYEKAFGFERKFIAPENVYAELITGETTLSICHKDFASKNFTNGFVQSNIQQKPFGFEIGFVTNDVDAVVEKALLAGASLLETAKQKPWGQTVAYLRDVDGFIIEICTPIY